MSHFYKNYKPRGRRPAGFTEELTEADIRNICEVIKNNPDWSQRQIEKEIVAVRKSLGRNTFYRFIQQMIETDRIRPVYKGRKKTFRVIDSTEKMRKTSIDIPGHLGRLSEEVSRLRREYPRLHLVDKITMSIAYMRNNLEFSKEIEHLSTVTGNETKQQRDAKAACKANREEILKIISSDADAENVLPHVVKASPDHNNFGIFRVGEFWPR